MIVTNLFLTLLIPMAVFSLCIELQYLMDDEFHVFPFLCNTYLNVSLSFLHSISLSYYLNSSLPVPGKKPSVPTVTNPPRLGSLLQRSKKEMPCGDTAMYFQHLLYLLLYFLTPVHQLK